MDKATALAIEADVKRQASNDWMDGIFQGNPMGLIVDMCINHCDHTEESCPGGMRGWYAGNCSAEATCDNLEPTTLLEKK